MFTRACAVVVAASPGTSIESTAAVAPARALFVTPTRIWELGVGGLLAVATGRSGPRPFTVQVADTGACATGRLLACVGGGMVADPRRGDRYSGATTPWPGLARRVPILGARP